MRYGMVIDLSRCVGCQACTVACKQKNGTPPGVFWGRVLVSETGKYPNARMQFTPILCMHCEKPACKTVCPTGATAKQANGIVTVDAEKCIGCRYCMVACPYDARGFNYSSLQPQYAGQKLTAFERAHVDEHPVGKVGKCNFCADRVQAGQSPKCVETCPAKARFFGNLDDPQSEVSQLIAKRGGHQLRAELGTSPSVYYLPA
jgi:molybdopterin-containing oxidoreductase family iron-sulfur binding subunit